MTKRQIRLDMGYRIDEFADTLRRAFGRQPAWRCTGKPPHWLLEGPGDTRVSLDILPLPDRHLGPLTLPRLQAVMDVEAGDSSAIDAFLRHFHRHFHKGGG
jgi:hypothetical protein